MPNVAIQPGVMPLKTASGAFPGIGRSVNPKPSGPTPAASLPRNAEPETSMRRLHIAPSGAVIETAACSTPGTATTRWWMRSYAARRAAGARSARRASITASSTRPRSKPSGTCVSPLNDRRNRPAPTRSTSERATCARTSPLAIGVWLDAPGVRPRSFIASIGAPRVARHAGATPKTSAAMRPAAAVNASMRASSGSSRDTASEASCATRSRLPQCATATPAAAPMAASSRLSISSWRASRPRDAPSASRTLHSWLRAVARASSRLAMLAQAISSTNPATAIRTSSGRE